VGAATQTGQLDTWRLGWPVVGWRESGAGSLEAPA